MGAAAVTDVLHGCVIMISTFPIKPYLGDGLGAGLCPPPPPVMTAVPGRQVVSGELGGCTASACVQQAPSAPRCVARCSF
jgi:hypothetical protein